MKTACVIGIGFACTLASGQSINIDFGSAGTAPAWHYAAGAAAGTWNETGIPPDFERVPLVGLDGSALPARLYQYGLSQMLSHDIPATSGDHQALMDDMALSFCNPVDGCVWIEDLLNGEYEVVIYGLTPNNPTLLSQTRVDFATSGPVWIGGVWPGVHQQGISFSRHRVTISNGKIGLHSGIFNGAIQAGINGIQLTYLDGPPIEAYAEAMTVAPGPLTTGSLQSLRKSDNSRLFMFCDSQNSSAELELIGRSPVLDPESIVVSIESRSTHPSMAVVVDAFNFSTNEYDNLGIDTLTQFETHRTYTIASNPDKYVEDSQGLMKFRQLIVPFQDLLALDGWNNVIDQAIWRVDP